jgi:hypothetical protein
MKWLKRLIWQWNQEGREIVEYDDGSVPMNKTRARLATIRSSADIDSDEGLNITVRKAIGGKIVSFRHYDHKADRTNYKLYVVSDDLDFDKELGKMITMESMRI